LDFAALLWCVPRVCQGRLLMATPRTILKRYNGQRCPYVACYQRPTRGQGLLACSGMASEQDSRSTDCGTRQNVIGAAALRARPTPFNFELLQALKPPSTEGGRLVGILVPGRWDYWEVPLIEAVEQQLKQHDCRFSRAYTLGSPGLVVREFQKLVSQEPKAILMVPPPSGYVSNSFQRGINKLDIPIIAIDQRFGEYPCVEPNHQLGSAGITKTLLDDRPSAVVLVFGNERVQSSAGRVRGFNEAIQNHARNNCRVERIEFGESPLVGDSSVVPNGFGRSFAISANWRA